MKTRQHPISTHLQRIADALLPGGYWQADRFKVALCPAGVIAHRAMKCPAMRNRAMFIGARKA